MRARILDYQCYLAVEASAVDKMLAYKGFPVSRRKYALEQRERLRQMASGNLRAYDGLRTSRELARLLAPSMGLPVMASSDNARALWFKEQIAALRAEEHVTAS